MLTRDLRYAWRMWRAHPLLTAAAIVSLAIGMGANTAVFTVLDAVLFTSAPVGDPRTLALLYSTRTATPGLHGNSFHNYEDLRRTLPFDVAAVAPLTVGFAAGAGVPNEIPAEIVSDNYFSVLRVRPARGRVFAPGEDATGGASPVVVLSDAFWRRRFGARADVIGTTVSVNARPFVVVGVAAPGFAGLDVMRPADLWIPSWRHADALTGVQRFYFRQRTSEMFDIVARLGPPRTAAEVGSVLQARASELERAFPNDNRGLGLTSRPLREAGLDPAKREVWVRAGGLLAAVVSLVLMLACANVANLLFARSASRRREISLRLAIGASRRCLAKQFLTESALLSASGGLGGLLVAAIGLRVLVALRPPFIPPTFAPSLDLTTLGFTGVLAVGTAIVFGLVPILYVSRDDVLGGLKGAPLRTGRATRIDPGRVLLALQSMLAMVALVLAGLFLRNLQRARTIDPGFQTSRLAVVSFDLGVVQYDNVRGAAFVSRVNEAVRAIPGVTTSAVSSHVVLEGTGLETKIRLAGQRDAEALGVHAQAVGLDYFATVGIRVLEGRTFRPTDTGISAFGWAVVNRTFARQLWPGRSALGQQFQLIGIPEPYVVVGVVEDAQYELLGEGARPFFYISYDQAPGIKKLSLFVRTERDPERLLPTIERAVRAVDPQLPISGARTMAGVLHRAMWAPRVGSALLTIFGAIALLLAVVGTYGVTAFLVRRRQREIGIRVAIGATPLRILGGVVSWTMTPALTGIVLGVGLARICARLGDGLLIGGAASTDAPSFAAAAGVLVASAALAAVVPALAALRLDPKVVLGSDP